MAGHLESAPVSGFHIGDGTDVEPAHFWSQGPLVNGVRSWQLIIKHDLTHQFHIQTLGVCPSVQFHFSEGTDVEPAHFWRHGPLVNGVRSWQLNMVRHIGSMIGHQPQCPGFTSMKAPMWNLPTSGARVHL